MSLFNLTCRGKFLSVLVIGQTMVLSNYKLLRPLMNIINPLTVRLWGANINRETIFNIKKAGFAIKEEKNLKHDVLKFVVAVNPS